MTKEPVVITGDFNSPPTGSGSGAYMIITAQEPAVPVNATFAKKYASPGNQLPSFKMLDLKAEVPRFKVSGNYATYTDWNAPNDTSAWSRIDFVFGGNNGGW
jgi:endonuclease/exonuclease/phosphatase family metal-dependent hydrolase